MALAGIKLSELFRFVHRFLGATREDIRGKLFNRLLAIAAAGCDLPRSERERGARRGAPRSAASRPSRVVASALRRRGLARAAL